MDIVASLKPTEVKSCYIYACAHKARDKRCGFVGPILVESLKATTLSMGISSSFVMLKCSHIGGHIYAGNVLVFRPLNGDPKVFKPVTSSVVGANGSLLPPAMGDWYVLCSACLHTFRLRPIIDGYRTK
jgi:hypothetical protein